MSVGRDLAASVIVICLCHANGGLGEWTRINGGLPIDSGAPIEPPFSMARPVPGVVSNGSKELMFLVNYADGPMTCGRIVWGGSEAGWVWQVWSSGQFVNDSTAVPTAVPHVAARFTGNVNLIPVPGTSEDIFAVAGLPSGRLQSSTQWLDIHGQPVNFKVSAADGWSQWNCTSTTQWYETQRELGTATCYY